MYEEETELHDEVHVVSFQRHVFNDMQELQCHQSHRHELVSQLIKTMLPCD